MCIIIIILNKVTYFKFFFKFTIFCGCHDSDVTEKCIFDSDVIAILHTYVASVHITLV